MVKSVRNGRRQYGVIPVRLAPGEAVEVLLITSRGTGRWVIPKGWPMKHRTPAEAAAIEAYEEAGLRGRVAGRVGAYSYRKPELAGDRVLEVVAFLMVVEQELPEWPERGERERVWFSAGEAAALVAEHGLARMLKRLPRLLGPAREFLAVAPRQVAG